MAPPLSHSNTGLWVWLRSRGGGAALLPNTDANGSARTRARWRGVAGVGICLALLGAAIFLLWHSAHGHAHPDRGLPGRAHAARGHAAPPLAAAVQKQDALSDTVTATAAATGGTLAPPGRAQAARGHSQAAPHQVMAVETQDARSDTAAAADPDTPAGSAAHRAHSGKNYHLSRRFVTPGGMQASSGRAHAARGRSHAAPPLAAAVEKQDALSDTVTAAAAAPSGTLAAHGHAHGARGHNHAATPLAAAVNKQDAFCDTATTGSALSLFNIPATPTKSVHSAAEGGGGAEPYALSHSPNSGYAVDGRVQGGGAGAAANGASDPTIPSRHTRAARMGGGGRALATTSGVSSPQPRHPPTPQAAGGTLSDDEPEVEFDYDNYGPDELGSGANIALRPALGSLAVSFAGLRAGALPSKGPSHAWAPAAARGNDLGGREGSPL